MIDKQKILADLNKYFTRSGEITIDDQTGKVSVTGDVNLRSSIKHAQMPFAPILICDMHHTR